MEFWARWAHKALWHGSLWNMHEVGTRLEGRGHLFSMHALALREAPALSCREFRRVTASPVLHALLCCDWKQDSGKCGALGSLWRLQSHHKPREGPFELNDIFAIINAGPAIGLLAYGFFFPGLVPAVCFGAVRLKTARAFVLPALAHPQPSSKSVP